MASSKEIEREVEAQRASVESTLGALRDKMSVGQIVDEFGGYVGVEDTRVALRNVGRQVRDNPVAFGLVGVGLAWLMFGSGRRSGADYDRSREDWESSRYPYSEDGEAGYTGGSSDYAAPGTTGERYGSAYGSPYDRADRDDGERGDGMLSRASHAVSSAASSVGQTVSDAVSGASETVSHAVSGATGRVRSAGEAGRRRMRGMGDRLPSSGRLTERGERMGSELADIVERQPLLVGAVAAAIGVAIGAALPSTRTEDRWLGERRDGMVEDAKRAAADLRHQAVSAAKAGVHAAADAARAEGLAPEPGGKTLAERVENVVRTGVEEAKHTLEGSGEDDKTPKPASTAV